MRRHKTDNERTSTTIRTIRKSELGSVRGGVGECTPADPNGDGTTTDAELENAMLYENELL